MQLVLVLQNLEQVEIAVCNVDSYIRMQVSFQDTILAQLIPLLAFLCT